jgi:hypothetical protein
VKHVAHPSVSTQSFAQYPLNAIWAAPPMRTHDVSKADADDATLIEPLDLATA